MDQLGLDTDHKSAFTPVDGRQRAVDRPDLVPRVYNEFSHVVLKVITKKNREYFGYECAAYATKLEFQERNMPHHHQLL